MLFEGFSDGFRIPSVSDFSLPFIYDNQKSIYANHIVVYNKIEKKIILGRVAGPFDGPPFPNLGLSPLGLVPKKEPGSVRLIHNLSLPKGCSVNAGIDPELCSVSYTSFDKAIAF